MRLSTFALAALLPAAAFAAPIKTDSQALAARNVNPGRNNHPAIPRLHKRGNWGGDGNDNKCTPKGHRKADWKGKHDPASDNYDPDAKKSWHHGDGKSWGKHGSHGNDKSWEQAGSSAPSPAEQAAAPAWTESAAAPAWNEVVSSPAVTEAPASTEETPSSTEEPAPSSSAQSDNAWVEAPSTQSAGTDNTGVDLHAQEPGPVSSAAPEPQPTSSAAPEPEPTTSAAPETSTWVAPEPETSTWAPEPKTSTWVAPEPEPTPEPEQPSNNGGGGNWDFPNGKATHWNTAGEDYWCRTAPGVGSSLTNGDYDMVVAISWELFGGNPNQPQNYDKCGQWVELQWNDRPTVRAQVIDACMSCDASHIDLSKGTFQAVGAGLGLGMIGTHNPSNDYEKPDSFKWRFV